MEKLLQKYPDLIQYLGDDQAMTNALTNLKGELNQKAFERVDVEMKAISDILNGYGVDVSAYGSAQEAKTALARSESQKRLDLLKQEMMHTDGKSIAEIGSSFLAVSDMQMGLNNASAQIDKYFDLSKFKSNLSNFAYNIGDKDYDGKKNAEPKESKPKKSESQKAEEIKDITNRVDNYLKEREALKRVSEEMEKSKSIQENLYGDKLIKQKEYDIQLLIQKSQLTDELVQKQQRDMKASEQLLQSFGMNAKGGTISNYQDVINAKVAWANSQQTVQGKKDGQEHVRQLEEEVKKYFELSGSITSLNSESQKMLTDVSKLRQEIIDINLNLSDEKVKKVEESTKNLNSQITLMNIDENAKMQQQINKYERKLSLTKDILTNIQTEHVEYTNVISYLQKQQEGLEVGSKAWTDINNKIISYQDKLRGATEQMKAHNDAVKDLTMTIINKELEMAVYGGSKRDFEDDKNAKINALKEELRLMKEQNDLEKEEDERKNKKDEIAKLEEKLRALQSGNLKNLNEQKAKELGLENERERAIQRQQEKEEKRKKFEEERQKRIEEHNKKVLEFEEKMNNLMRNRPIQTFGSVNGVWDLRYTQDQEEIDKLKKDMDEENEKFKKESEEKQSDYDKDRIKSEKDYQKDLLKQKENLYQEIKKKKDDFDRWEKENQRKREEEALNNQIQALENEMKVREEYLNRAKQDLSEFFADENNMFDLNGKKINNKTLDSLEKLRNIYGTQFNKIIDDIKEAVERMNFEWSKADFGNPNGGEFGEGGGSNVGGGSADRIKMTTDMANRLYARDNPDVAEALRRGVDDYGNRINFSSLFQHYALFGRNEGRTGYYDQVGQWFDRDNLGSFDTGGWYTGDFEGARPALLHKKELVVNAQDTPMLLKAMEVSKDFMSNFVSKMQPSFRVPELSGMLRQNDVQKTIQFNNAKFVVEGIQGEFEAENFFNTLTSQIYTYTNRNK